MPRGLIGALALAALGVVLWVAGTTPAPGLEGVWFAETLQRGGVVQEILERRDDGRLRSVLRTLDGCHPRSLVVREGRWWPEPPGRLAQRIERVDGADAPGAPPAEAFTVLLLRADRLSLRDERGRVREALRVPLDFEFPPPAGCPDPPPLAPFSGRAEDPPGR